MGQITEVDQYDASIYEIETTDPVIGGPGGIANQQAQGLANRTNWLKSLLATFGNIVTHNANEFDPAGAAATAQENAEILANTMCAQQVVNPKWVTIPYSGFVAGVNTVNVTLPVPPNRCAMIKFYGSTLGSAWMEIFTMNTKGKTSPIINVPDFTSAMDDGTGGTNTYLIFVDANSEITLNLYLSNPALCDAFQYMICGYF